MSQRILIALPVYNEAAHLTGVLDEVLRLGCDVLVVDDGSTDGTSQLLAQRHDVQVVRHRENRGYGAALHSAFDFVVTGGYDVLVTIDCDGQHQPRRIPRFVEMLGPVGSRGFDIVSGSRYLERFPGDSRPPEDRRRINQTITEELNRKLRLHLTDAFCGFKAYRAEALAKIQLTETGYAMPLEFWVKAVRAKLRVIELSVPLIYLEEERSFGGAMDRAEVRLGIYRDVLAKYMAEGHFREAAQTETRESAHDDVSYAT